MVEIRRAAIEPLFENTADIYRTTASSEDNLSDTVEYKLIAEGVKCRASRVITRREIFNTSRPKTSMFGYIKLFLMTGTDLRAADKVIVYRRGKKKTYYSLEPIDYGSHIEVMLRYDDEI